VLGDSQRISAISAFHLAALDPLEDLELASRERQVALRCGAPPGPVDDALEVGSEELEHKPIALPEVALLRVEQERSGVTGARRRDPYLELVLVRAEDHVVELARAPLAGRQKVRHTPRPKVTGAGEIFAHCVLVLELPVRVLDIGIARPRKLVGFVGDATPLPVELAVRDDLGRRHELAESRNELWRDRKTAFQLCRVVDEREKPRDVTVGQRFHVPKDTTNVVSTQSPGPGSLRETRAWPRPIARQR